MTGGTPRRDGDPRVYGWVADMLAAGRLHARGWLGLLSSRLMVARYDPIIPAAMLRLQPSLSNQRAGLHVGCYQTVCSTESVGLTGLAIMRSGLLVSVVIEVPGFRGVLLRKTVATGYTCCAAAYSNGGVKAALSSRARPIFACTGRGGFQPQSHAVPFN